MKRILVDVDAVTADLMPVWLGLYNKEYGDILEPKDIFKWGIHEIVKPECGAAIFGYLEHPTLYDDVKPIDGAISSIRWLRQHSYDVRFVTSGVFESKIRWLGRHGLLMSENHLYSPDVVVAHDKSIIRADIMIDDNPENCEMFKGKSILFAQPWNEQYSGHSAWFRADGWADVIQYLARGL